MSQELLRLDDIRDVENASEEAGLSKAVLMDRAGHGIAELATEIVPSGCVVVLCGSGNNGGDGWVAARLLRERGREVSVICGKAPSELKGLAGAVATEALAAGVPWIKDPSDEDLEDRIFDAELVIDGMFGAGFHGEIGEPYATWIDVVEESDVPVLAIDVPTGLAGDTGTIGGRCLRADWTLATIAGKLGMVGGLGGTMAGRVVVSDLGIEEILPGHIASRALARHLSEMEYARMLPRPAADANKYSRGYLLVVGGSVSYPGAAIMASMSAARSGSGYVRLCVPDPVVPICQMHLLSTPVEGFPAADGAFAAEASEALVKRAARADAMVLGPGITDSAGTRAVVAALLEQVEAPILVDADALGIVAKVPDSLRVRAEAGRVTVLTPHEGEMARLLEGIGHPEALERPSDIEMRIKAAKLAAEAYGAVVVLKGPATVIATDDASVSDDADTGMDGTHCILNGSGCPALATSGTGDVLSGIIGALLSQGMGPLKAAALGVHLHGLAGEAAAYMMDEICVVAEDVIECIPQAVAMLVDEEETDE